MCDNAKSKEQKEEERKQQTIETNTHTKDIEVCRRTRRNEKKPLIAWFIVDCLLA